MASEIGSSNSKAIVKGKKTTGRELTALIVDDISVIRYIHRYLLSQYGFKIFEAENGEEAVGFCQIEHFDIIIMNYRMPVMNGVEATKKIRDMGVPSIIVGVTISTDAAVKEGFRLAGVDYFYPSPLTDENLAIVLNNQSTNLQIRRSR